MTFSATRVIERLPQRFFGLVSRENAFIPKFYLAHIPFAQSCPIPKGCLLIHFETGNFFFADEMCLNGIVFFDERIQLYAARIFFSHSFA